MHHCFAGSIEELVSQRLTRAQGAEVRQAAGNGVTCQEVLSAAAVDLAILRLPVKLLAGRAHATISFLLLWHFLAAEAVELGVAVEPADPAFEAVGLDEADFARHFRHPLKGEVAENRVSLPAAKQGDPWTCRTRLGSLVKEPAIDEAAHLAWFDLYCQAVESVTAQPQKGTINLLVPPHRCNLAGTCIEHQTAVGNFSAARCNFDRKLKTAHERIIVDQILLLGTGNVSDMSFLSNPPREQRSTLACAQAVMRGRVP